MADINVLSFSWARVDNPDFRDDLAAYLTTGSEHWEPLLKNDLIETTFSALTTLKREIEAELADLNAERSSMQAECWTMGHWGKKKWFDYEAGYKAQRAGLVQRKSRVENALSRAKPRLAQYRREVSQAESDRTGIAMAESETLRNVVLQLVTAITEHQQSIEASANTPTVSDRALWSVLARAKLPTRNGDLTLREWFARTILR